MPFTTAFAPRPNLAFRVGVTGSRHLDAAAVAALREPVAAVLRRVRETIDDQMRERDVRAVYELDPGSSAVPRFRILSSLAEGADRLVAEEAMKLGFALHAPLPFAPAIYEKDFPASLDAFRRLLAQARVSSLDGGRSRDEAASYEAAGRFVARNCDLLIALWDGVSDDKRGGTGQILQFAARGAVPIWWIDTADGTPRRITKSSHLRHPGRAPTGAAAERALVTELLATVRPPAAPVPARDGVLGWAAHRLRPSADLNDAPLTLWLREPDRLAATGLWRAHILAQEVLGLSLTPARSGRPESARPDGPRPAAPEPPNPPESAYWEAIHRRADGLSTAYGNRYRSSYVLVIAFAFCAVVAATVGGALGSSWLPTVITPVEVALLAGIGVMVYANHANLWQERWITYRLLAELCRKQMVLAQLGRSLPGGEVSRSAAEAAAGHAPEHAPVPAPSALPAREAWVGWYFLACLRAAPLPTGDMCAAAERALAAGRSLATAQRLYHAGRGRVAGRVERRFAVIGELFFILTGVGLALRLVASAQGWPIPVGSWIGAGAAVLSSVSASFVGLRAYSEYALLARQSARMVDLMTEAEADLAEVELDHPLASDELGALLHRLVMAMMREVGGWAQLFRLKSVETG